MSLSKCLYGDRSNLPDARGVLQPSCCHGLCFRCSSTQRHALHPPTLGLPALAALISLCVSLETNLLSMLYVRVWCVLSLFRRRTCAKSTECSWSTLLRWMPMRTESGRRCARCKIGRYRNTRRLCRSPVGRCHHVLPCCASCSTAYRTHGSDKGKGSGTRWGSRAEDGVGG